MRELASYSLKYIVYIAQCEAKNSVLCKRMLLQGNYKFIPLAISNNSYGYN